MIASPDAGDQSDELNSEGHKLHSEGRFEDAIALFTRALALDPDNDSAHANLAAALFKQEKYAEALVSVQRAIQIDPKQPVSHNCLGMVLRELGKYPEAVAAHERALSLRPDYPNGYYNLALVLVDADRLSEAATACEAAAKLDPGKVEIHRELEWIFEKLEKPDQVETALRRGWAATADDTLGYSLAHFLAGQKRWPEAESVLRAILDRDPRFTAAHVELGYVLVERGKIEEGIGHQLEALRLDSSNEQAKINLYLARKKQA